MPFSRVRLGRRPGRSVLLLALAVPFVLGCSVTTKVRSVFGGEVPLSVSIVPDANDNSAVAVDLIVVYDEKVLEQLMKMRARQWFAGKKQFIKDYPTEIKVEEWEWIPSQVVDAKPVTYHAGARKVLLFADYASEGEHRLAVDPQEHVDLVLDTLDFHLRRAR